MLAAGIDLGTSGCRLVIINQQADIVHESRLLYPNNITQTPELWWDTVCHLFAETPDAIRQQLASISIDGTSGSLLLCDANGQPTSPVLMYNDTRATEEAAMIAKLAPENSGAHGAASSLAKLLYLTNKATHKQHQHALHQADWIANRLLEQYGLSDENNCLKLGYDSVKQSWGDWMAKLPFPQRLLPKVQPVGSCFGTISAKQAQTLKLPKNVKIIAGTTDSIAAFIATGAKQLGDAVTSLGSTLVVKIVSDKPIFAKAMGVYSHRFGKYWLVGGASNSGCAVLLKYFNLLQIKKLTNQINPKKLLNLGYYPLLKIGERFPIADTNKAAILEPRPASNVAFFQAILEGIADIEALAYQTLEHLGAPKPNNILTVGGGSINQAWRYIREKKLNLKIKNPYYSEAAYGSALIALKGHYK